MQNYLIDGDRGIFWQRPALFPGGGCLVAGVFCGLNSFLPVLVGGRWRDFLEPLGIFVIGGNLLIACVGLAAMCVISTVVIDRQSRDVITLLELIPPGQTRGKLLSRSVYSLLDFN